MCRLGRPATQVYTIARLLLTGNIWAKRSATRRMVKHLAFRGTGGLHKRRGADMFYICGQPAEDQPAKGGAADAMS